MSDPMSLILAGNLLFVTDNKKNKRGEKEGDGFYGKEGRVKGPPVFYSVGEERKEEGAGKGLKGTGFFYETGWNGNRIMKG